MNNDTTLQTSIISKLKEIADEYGITFTHSDNFMYLHFYKHDVGLSDPAFSYAVDWGVKKVNIFHLNKTFELVNIESYTRLLCEVIS